MAADKWRRYNKFPEYLGDGTIDIDNDTFIGGLALSTSNVATLTLTVLAGLTNEHAVANGYARQTLLSVTWLESAGVVAFDAASWAFAASGGSIIARFGFIFDDTPAGAVVDPLVAYSLLDNSPTDVTVTDGNTLTIDPDVNGILRLSGGQVA